MVNFKIFDVIDWTTKLMTIHILPNVSKSKSNPAIKFDKLIKYSVRNIFL